MLSSQQLAGNRATAAAIAVQRNGNGKPVTERAEKAVRGIGGAAGAIATASFSASTTPEFRDTGVAEGIGSLSAVSDLAAAWIALGADVAVLASSIRGAVTARSKDEHEKAVQAGESAAKVLEGGLATGWSAGRQVSNMIGTFAKEGTALKGAGELGNSVAALPVAYLNFSTNLVKVGKNYMTLADLEETQFNAWESPDKAKRAAEQEEGAAQQAMMSTAAALTSLEDAADKRRRLFDLVEETYGKVIKAKEDALKTVSRPSKAQEVEDAFWNEMARWTKRREEEKDRLAQLNLEIARLSGLKVDIIQVWGWAADKTTARAKFKAAVDKEVAEQKKARAHPADRYASLPEIHLYAMASIRRRAWQNKALTAAALIGFAGGVVGLALGWTPVGWALIATSGAIALGIAGFKLGRFALEKLEVIRNKSQAYANHLWQYATLGTTDKEPATDDEVKKVRRQDALELIRSLGLDPATVQQMDTKTAIKKITEKLEGK